MTITTSKPVNAIINNVNIRKNNIINLEEIVFDLNIEDIGLHITSEYPLVVFKNILYKSNDEFVSSSIHSMISGNNDKIIKLIKDAKVKIKFNNGYLEILNIELSEMSLIKIEIYNYYISDKMFSLSDKAKEVMKNRINERIKKFSDKVKDFEHYIQKLKNDLSELDK